jgi:two-component sensor histidine kinase
MENEHTHKLRHLFILFFVIVTSLHIWADSMPIVVSNTDKTSLLQHSLIYIAEPNESLKDIIAKKKFSPYTKDHINIGISKKTVWLQFTLRNSSMEILHKVLIPSSPLLECIDLYPANDISQKRSKGMMHTPAKHNTIPYYFNIRIKPYSNKSYYMRVSSVDAPVSFSLTLEDQNTFYKEDKLTQAVNILLVGVVLALMIYAFILSFYIKDKSYFYYALYLLALLYQQVTYLGLTQIYLPQTFISVDMSIVLVKLVLLISSSALFAIHFLDTAKLPFIDKIYKGIIILTLLELLLLEAEDQYSLMIVIITGIVFITFNMIAGILSYLHGHKQARLFILGFGIVFISYVFIILDALGYTSVMVHFQSVLIWSTALEAFILSLAFADRYIILQREKEATDKRILLETQDRTKRIQKEVDKKTYELNMTLKTKELLIQEVHHRVKNNLQIILSIIRLQNDEIDDPTISDSLSNLEHRINAISKTYTMLLITDDLGNIDMEKYVDALLEDIHDTYAYKAHNVNIKTNIDAIIPLKESVYLGLIINELVVNAYKYAFDDKDGTITVTLKKIDDHYVLIIEDNGKGFIISKTNSLGLKLIHTLIYNQLEGTMDIDTYEHTQYIIRFKI